MPPKPLATAQKVEVQSNSPDADYLMSDEIGLVIAKGMQVLYKTNPKNPVDFLAKWLLNVSQVHREAVSQQQEAALVKQNQLKHEREIVESQKAEKLKQEKAQQWEKEIQTFNSQINESRDLSDQLQHLNDHLKAGTKATAVYIGKVCQPKKPITDSDNDKAHIDKNASAHIHFGYANPEHQFIVDQILEQGKGLTFEVFQDKPVEENPKEELDDEGNPVPKMDIKEGEKLPQYLTVPEVVREGKIHFFKVPRLGSYMAIRLEYQTCLYEEAFDAGVSDTLRVNEMRREQDEARANFEKTQIEAKEQAEADGEVFKPEKKEWEVIEAKPYQTRTVQLVCCLNTMGQDRKFTAEEKLFALRTVQRYRDRWEQSERENLKADIARKITQQESDKQYKEFCESLDIAELEIRTEAAGAQKEGQEPLTEELKASAIKKAKFAQLTKTFFDPEGTVAHQRQVDRDKIKSQNEARTSPDGQQPQTSSQPKYYPLTPEHWKKPLFALRQCYIMKNPRVLQTLFYLLGYTREQISERGTNALNFKLAKEFINESLLQKMGTYNPLGGRESEFKEYQKLSFLKNNIEGIDEDKVENFSLVMAKILKWLQLAIEIRCEDVVNRRDTVEYIKQEREQAIKADAERKAKFDKELQEKKAAFEESLQAEGVQDDDAEEGSKPKHALMFDEREFKVEFELANPEIVIVSEVKDEVDNDYDLPYKPPSLGEE